MGWAGPLRACVRAHPILQSYNYLCSGSKLQSKQRPTHALLSPLLPFPSLPWVGCALLSASGKPSLRLHSLSLSLSPCVDQFVLASPMAATAAVAIHQFAECITCHAWSPDLSSNAPPSPSSSSFPSRSRSRSPRPPFRFHSGIS